MIKNNFRRDYDLVIVRPYLSLPHESAGVDRYFSLLKKMNELGFTCLLITSNFHHNTKQFRDQELDKYDNVLLINAGSYASNHSFSRVIYEIIFMLRSFLFLINVSTKAVLIGEPVFGSTMFSLLMKFRKCVIISDVIDLIPEALRVKVRSNFSYILLSIPLRLIRSLRIKFLFDFVSVVSESYKKILNLDDSKSGVFYWGLNEVYDVVRIKDNRVKRVVYAGSLGDGYDIEILINLAKIRDDVEVIIAGSGPKAPLCKDAHRRGFVTYLGQLREEELHELYLTSDIGVLPYKKDSAVAMPIKFFDYVSYNLKIVSSLHFESSDVILENKIGFVYEPENLKSLSLSLDRVIELPCQNDRFNDLCKLYNVDKQYNALAKKIISLISKPL